jgi:hypothetical protein
MCHVPRESFPAGGKRVANCVVTITIVALFSPLIAQPCNPKLPERG